MNLNQPKEYLKLNASMSTVINNMHKFQSILTEINKKSSLIEICQESANKVALFTEDANETRLTTAELRERLQKVVNDTQCKFLKYFVCYLFMVFSKTSICCLVRYNSIRFMKIYCYYQFDCLSLNKLETKLKILSYKS